MLTPIPWQERPAGSKDIMWRYTENPVIGRYDIPSSNSIFNSAVVRFGDGFAGVFRCDNKRVQMNIFAGFSKDGIHWDINHEPIKFVPGNTEMIDSDYKYDPRVAWIEDRYWVTWCNGYHGPTIGIAYTFDFQTFYQCENAFLPFNRNGVLFPEKINGKYAMLSRPSDSGHTPFGDIYISFSPDMKYWGEHRSVMKTVPFEQSAWQCLKIGAAYPHRRGLADVLPRRYPDVQWLPLFYGCRPARPCRPHQGAAPLHGIPSRACRALRTLRRCAQRGVSLRRPARGRPRGRVLRRGRYLRRHGVWPYIRNHRVLEEAIIIVSRVGVAKRPYLISIL